MCLGAPDDSDLGGTILRLQELDDTATDTMTPKAWLSLQKRFKRSYMLTSAIGYDSDVTDLQLARLAGTNVMLTALNGARQFGAKWFWGSFFSDGTSCLREHVSVGMTTSRIVSLKSGRVKRINSHNALIFYDKRKAVEFVSQMNTDIIETTRDMLKQVEYIVCSEIWGWISYQPKKAIYIVVMGNPHADATLEIAA